MARKQAGNNTAEKEAAEKATLAGVVTHYFGNIGVAIVKCKRPIAVGDTLWFKGATTDFRATISFMQYEHKPIEKSKKGQEVGIKVKERVREGDAVYKD